VIPHRRKRHGCAEGAPPTRRRAGKELPVALALPAENSLRTIDVIRARAG
jgi:hypothetical protein